MSDPWRESILARARRRSPWVPVRRGCRIRAGGGPRLADEPGGCDLIVQLGVTPELAAARWPQGSELLAVDASAAMIEQAWRPRDDMRASAVLGNWNALPLAEGAADLVIGDASLNSGRLARGRGRGAARGGAGAAAGRHAGAAGVPRGRARAAPRLRSPARAPASSAISPSFAIRSPAVCATAKAAWYSPG